MPFYERGSTRIYYEEAGSGFPLMISPGGGLNSSIASLSTSVPFNPMVTYRDDFRCIAADLRNAPPRYGSPVHTEMRALTTPGRHRFRRGTPAVTSGNLLAWGR